MLENSPPIHPPMSAMNAGMQRRIFRHGSPPSTLYASDHKLVFQKRVLSATCGYCSATSHAHLFIPGVFSTSCLLAAGPPDDSSAAIAPANPKAHCTHHPKPLTHCI